MRTLRIYKVLIPGLLAVVVVLLVLQLKPVGGVHSQVAGPDGLQIGSSAQGVTAVDMDGARKQMEIRAAGIQRDDSGSIDLDRIHELKLFRDDMLPLVVEALSGKIEGAKGTRTMTFTEGVSLDDPERRLKVQIPGLILDEAAREARAEGEVELRGSGVAGTATRLVYRIDGLPAELETLVLTDDTGGRLSARQATLHDGLDDIELQGDVHAERGREFLDARHLRVKRHPNDKLAWAAADGDVRGAAALDPTQLAQFSAAKLEAAFDEGGRPRGLQLDGGANLTRGIERIQAESLRAQRSGGSEERWRVLAQDDVVVETDLGMGPALLRAARVEALFSSDSGLLEGTAAGRVSLDGPDARAEADQAAFTAGEPGEIRLAGTARRKARLARLATRVAAEEITTDPRGERLLAERGVEATLLPGGRTGMPVPGGPFAASEPVHFVSETLVAEGGGRRLAFDGQVRGWQGERNLSAAHVRIDGVERTLVAESGVTTRIPRREGAMASESDFVQVTADRLEYRDTARIGTFSGEVRVQLVEGWMEAQSVEFENGEEGSGLEEIRAQGSVRLEFREPAEEGTPQVLTGSADRVVYAPAEQTVWLIGDASPAVVRRIGEGRGTTTGRVLRYRLDLGTLEVESGRIQTGR